MQKSTLTHALNDLGRLVCGQNYESPITTQQRDAITCNRCRYLLKLPYERALPLKVHAPDSIDGSNTTLCGVFLDRAGGLANNTEEITCHRCRGVLTGTIQIEGDEE
jgi:hypothetical protein